VESLVHAPYLRRRGALASPRSCERGASTAPDVHRAQSNAPRPVDPISLKTFRRWIQPNSTPCEVTATTALPRCFGVGRSFAAVSVESFVSSTTKGSGSRGTSAAYAAAARVWSRVISGSESRPRDTGDACRLRPPAYGRNRSHGANVFGAPRPAREPRPRRPRLGNVRVVRRCELVYAAVCEHGFEGVVAKKDSDRYRPGERRWVKLKNPQYWRRDSEMDAIQRSAERRTAPAHRGR
jgi:hypothetical protein